MTDEPPRAFICAYEGGADREERCLAMLAEMPP